MKIREATIDDIRAIQAVRNSVKENVLSDPGLVTDDDCLDFLTNRGKGWVCAIGSEVCGFAIADLVDNNIWALFVHPDHEKKGIGSKLQKVMLDWYFSMDKDDIWLGTEPGTRAESFYHKSGWRKTGLHGRHEIKFEMTKAEWEAACGH